MVRRRPPGGTPAALGGRPGSGVRRLELRAGNWEPGTEPDELPGACDRTADAERADALRATAEGRRNGM